MLNVSEIATSAEERVLTGVKASQALVIDGMKNAVSLMDRVVPEQVADRVEGQMVSMPSATPMIDGAFNFAGKLLDAQRDFVGEMFAIIQPAPAKKMTAKKSTAKKSTAKTTAKKTTAKASAAKKTTARKTAA